MIEGGTPLCGRVRAAGNKNGALPILAACLLTDEPVVLDERAADPRRRDDGRRCSRHLGADVEWTGDERGPRPRGRAHRTHELDDELAEPDPRVVPARGPAARAARPRERAAARRRRDRPAPARPAHPRVRRARRRDRRSASATSCAPTGSAARTSSSTRRAVMATENAVMAAVARAGRDGDRERRLRAARPGPLPLPRLARRRRSRASASNVAAHPRRRAASRRRVPRSRRSTSRSASFIGLAAVTGGDVTIDDVEPEDLVADPARRSSGSASTSRSRARRVRVPPNQELVIRDDLGGQIPKIEDGPWPAFPADLTSIAVDRRDAGAGHDPDLREDVREPPVLRRQARLDGRADHPLRPAPRRRHRPGAALRRSGCRARTSAPGWRC